MKKKLCKLKQEKKDPSFEVQTTQVEIQDTTNKIGDDEPDKDDRETAMGS